MRFYILPATAKNEYDAIDVTVPVNVLAQRSIRYSGSSETTPGMCHRCSRGGLLREFYRVPAWAFALRVVLDANIATEQDVLRFQYKVISQNQSVFKEVNDPANRIMACDFCRSKSSAPGSVVEELQQKGAFFSLDEVRKALRRRQGLTG